ncbi:HAD family hydrolase [Saccharibacillus qingshengii]|uniref:HAD family hydrolase n=1 Tax=Saccharibacillus qingshengii TaxID=1763540 RepID=UPI001557CA0B|nr:HAD family hydrolase [Saccharibacillus qingshengii]
MNPSPTFNAAGIEVIAFDLDGTLIDTSEAMYDVNHRVFEEAIRNGDAAHQPSKETIRSAFGMTGPEAWKVVAAEMDEEKQDRYKQRHDERLGEAMRERSYALDGVPQLLRRLSGKYELATASNCGQDYLDRVLDIDDLAGLIRYPLCAGNVGAKRKSEVLQELLRRSGRGADRVLMVGDRKSDIEAAKEAGVAVIGVRSEFAEAGELDGADAVIDSIGELESLLQSSADRSA